ncbi:nucleoside triphosphate pyrophosphohydrolase [Clostridiales bacterium]|nr:nucleoside triphosphate pyrophosphohydrolase [Clostridiales bacterium]
MKRRSLTVVSIGPGDVSLLNQATVDTLRGASPLILRTDHHPMAAWLKDQDISYVSLDDLYESSDDFDCMNSAMADRVWQLAAEGKHAVYAVPDLLTDRSVDELFRHIPESCSEPEIIPGFSYADFYLARCRGLISSGNIRIVSASEFLSSFYDPEQSLLITEVDGAITAGDVKAHLSSLFDEESSVWLIQAGGRPVSLPLYELDRKKKYDHMTAVLVPGSDFLHHCRNTIHDLLSIMERLRAPDGCPWDSIQTHESLRPYMVEEAWEAVNAIDDNDPDHLADELGDLLFQIVFHASVGKSFGEFDFVDVVTNICTKMIHRHPHVFGSKHVSSPDEVSDTWEEIKRQETGSRTVSESLNDVSSGLPSLKYAIKVNKKVQQLPSWRRNPADIAEEIRNLSGLLLAADGSLDEKVMGKLLFLCTHLCHRSDRDAEIILHQAVDRFKSAFSRMENDVKSAGKALETLTFEEICLYLNKAEAGN